MTAARLPHLLVLRVLVVALMLVVAGRAAPVAAQTTTAPAPTAAPSPLTTAATAGDESSTRTVNRIIFVLVAFAVVLIGLAIWYWRATKPLPRHLDGLDVMGTRQWRAAGPGERST